MDFPLESLDLLQYVIGPRSNPKRYNLFAVSVSSCGQPGTFPVVSLISDIGREGTRCNGRSLGVRLLSFPIIFILWNVELLAEGGGAGNVLCFPDHVSVLYRIIMEDWTVGTIRPTAKMLPSNGGINLMTTKSPRSRRRL